MIISDAHRKSLACIQYPEGHERPIYDHICLVLSGGGFRATLFHLGVVRYLASKKLLSKVRIVSAVSGGSVLAGFLAVVWSELIDEDTDLDKFDRLMQPLIELMQADVRGRILRRLPLWGVAWLMPRFARTSQLQSLYQKHLETACMLTTDSSENEWKKLAKQVQRVLSMGRKDVDSVTSTKSALGPSGLNLEDLPDPDKTRFIFNASSLSDKELYSFSNKRVTLSNSISGAVFRNGKLLDDGLFSFPIAKAMAASSAFPPLFPPVTLRSDEGTLGFGNRGYVNRLTDGGVIDNYGIVHLAPIVALFEIEHPLYIVSDAGQQVPADHSRTFRWSLSRNIRVADLMMDSLGKRIYDYFENLHGKTSVARCSIVPSAVSAIAGQKELAECRTDLDYFSADLIEKLVDLGSTEAASQLSSHFGKTAGICPFHGTFDVWSRCERRLRKMLPSYVRAKLEHWDMISSSTDFKKESVRRLRIFSLADAITPGFHTLVLFALVVLVAIGGWYSLAIATGSSYPHVFVSQWHAPESQSVRVLTWPNASEVPSLANLIKNWKLDSDYRNRFDPSVPSSVWVFSFANPKPGKRFAELLLQAPEGGKLDLTKLRVLDMYVGHDANGQHQFFPGTRIVFKFDPPWQTQSFDVECSTLDIIVVIYGFGSKEVLPQIKLKEDLNHD